MSVEELLQHVPPEVIYRRVAVSDEENAFRPWQEAVKHVVVPSDDDAVWDELIGYGPDTPEVPDAELCPPPGASFDFPTGDDGRRIRRLLEENRRVLELFDEGIRRGKLQMPRYEDPRKWTDFVDIGALRNVSRIRKVKAKALAADGKLAQAGNQLIRILRTGEMLCGGDCYVVHYLAGAVLQLFASAVIRTFATTRHLPPKVRANLLAAVRRNLELSDGLVQTIRMEFCYWEMLCLDQFPDNGDLETLFEAWMLVFDAGPWFFEEEDEESDEAQSAARAEARVDKIRQRFMFLMSDHPHPFNKIATARLAGRAAADTIGSLSLPSPPRLFDLGGHWFRLRRWFRRRWLSRRVAVWPGGATGLALYAELLGKTDDEIQAKVAELELEECLGKKTVARMLPPTDAQLAAARKQLKRLDNPFGLLVANEVAPILYPYQGLVAQRRAELEQTKGTLEEPL